MSTLTEMRQFINPHGNCPLSLKEAVRQGIREAMRTISHMPSYARGGLEPSMIEQSVCQHVENWIRNTMSAPIIQGDSALEAFQALGLDGQGDEGEIA